MTQYYLKILVRDDPGSMPGPAGDSELGAEASLVCVRAWDGAGVAALVEWIGLRHWCRKRDQCIRKLHYMVSTFAGQALEDHNSHLTARQITLAMPRSSTTLAY
jgi:hypothetical protein